MQRHEGQPPTLDSSLADRIAAPNAPSGQDKNLDKNQAEEPPRIGEQFSLVQVVKRSGADSADRPDQQARRKTARQLPTHTQAQSIEDWWQQGTHALQAQDWTQAQTCYQQLLKLDPHHSQARWNLAMALELQGERQTAMKHYFRALSQDPTRLAVPDLCRFGDVLQQNHQLARALACYRWALKQADQAAIHMRIGQVLMEQKHYEKAAGSYQRAIEREPTWQAYHCWGDALLKLKRWKKAATAYRQAIQLNSDFFWAHHNLAQALGELQRWGAAEKAYQQAIRLDPQVHSTYSGWGELCIEQGKLEQAALLFRQGLQLRGWHSPALKEYTFTHDWFAHNIPVLQTQLQSFVDQPVNALEIGSFEGMSTCWFLEHILTHPAAQLTCIDPHYHQNFDPNLQKTGFSHKINKIVGNSHEVLATLAPESYDLIYIDGCHWADHVQIDGILSWKLIKPGGLVIFDDYEWSDPNKPGQDTQIGIDAFLSTVQSEVDLVYQGYQLFIRKHVASADSGHG
ncbi:MAG: tetratricopeptide repeat protein [Elainella sp. Prado103]|jgi:tetratricopeptide (TPR) repeat protein|nr:tetratricopeptide repeat protein [Elainella sp. Prado103]